MSDSEKIEIVRAEREVIEGKLLTALEDDSVAAVILNEDDLNHLILLMKAVRVSDWRLDRHESILNGLIRLRKECFD